jgi:hypothetical protein
MGKKLGNIPTQKKMSKEQEQAFTNGINKGRKLESERIIKLLIELNAIRYDVFGSLVAFNTDGTEVIYLTGLERS